MNLKDYYAELNFPDGQMVVLNGIELVETVFTILDLFSKLDAHTSSRIDNVLDTVFCQRCAAYKRPESEITRITRELNAMLATSKRR